MTHRDLDALAAIRCWSELRERTPSIRELARCLDVSSARAWQFVLRLRANGYLTFDRKITLRAVPIGRERARVAVMVEGR